MFTEEMKEAMREVMREVLAEYYEKFSNRMDLFSENRRPMENLSTGTERPEPRVDFAMGQWLVPEEVLAKWAARFPEVNIDQVLRGAASAINRGTSPGKHGYKRWLESRLRVEHQRRAVGALQASGDSAQKKLAPRCEGYVAGECDRPALLSMLAGGARHDYCSECSEAAHADELRRRATGT